ncbi:MAG: hypothetical protein LBL41_02345 [Bifidobacteriaceae bacterium]|jgi:hypothetical protein|nr:hypothetical protein [Bifidobacteriaceae bacterium]
MSEKDVYEYCYRVEHADWCTENDGWMCISCDKIGTYWEVENCGCED